MALSRVGACPKWGAAPLPRGGLRGGRAPGRGVAGRRSGKFQPFHKGGFPRSPHTAAFPWGLGVPLRPRRGPALPCPLWAGGPRRAPGHGTRHLVAGGAASARRSLPVGGIPRPRRAPPAAERSGGERERERGRPRGGGQGKPGGPGVPPGETPLTAVPPLFAFLLSFLALSRRHLPGGDGSERTLRQRRQVAVARLCSNTRS